MLQIYTNSLMNMYRLYDLQGTSMPVADKAKWFCFACLKKAGSGGYLGPGVSMYTRD